MGVVDKVRILGKGLPVKRGIYLGLIAVLLGVLSGCSSTPKDTVAIPTTTPSATQPVVVLPSGCKSTTAVGHAPKAIAPPSALLKEKVTTFTLVTNCGDIKIAVDQAKAPQTVTALTTLARGGYFDATLCHRLTTSGLYVLQCGDPTATGSGGPSFTYGDENLPTGAANNYPAGTVAMANSGANTNGSQFFLVYANTTLGPSYTIWGKITSGLNILKGIAAAGVKGGTTDGTPAQTIAIEKVIVK